MRFRSISFVSALILAISLSGTANAADSSIADKVYDIVLLRPLCGFSTIVGSVMFLPAALITLPTGRDGIDEAWQVFVSTPYQDTVDRPLGDFSY